MSSTNKTTYYELPQFVDDDIFNPLVDDNDAYEKIDTALHNIAEAEADDASEIVGVKGRVYTLEGKVDTLETQNGSEALTTTAQTLSGAVNELDSDVASLDERIDVVEDDINNVNTGLKAKVSALETQNGNEALATTAQTLSGAINENFESIKYYKNIITPEMFDAVGDGVADDTSAIQSAIDYALQKHCALIASGGKYKISSTINIHGYRNTDDNVVEYGDNFKIDFSCSEIIYTGSSYAFDLTMLVRGYFNFGVLTSSTGSGLNLNTYDRYHVIAYVIIDGRDIDVSGECIHVENSDNGWCNQCSIKNIKFSGGTYATHWENYSTNSINEWMIENTSLEGVDEGFYLHSHSDETTSIYIGDFTFINNRIVEHVSDNKHYIISKGRVNDVMILGTERTTNRLDAYNFQYDDGGSNTYTHIASNLKIYTPYTVISIMNGKQVSNPQILKGSEGISAVTSAQNLEDVVHGSYYGTKSNFNDIDSDLSANTQDITGATPIITDVDWFGGAVTGANQEALITLKDRYGGKYFKPIIGGVLQDYWLRNLLCKTERREPLHNTDITFPTNCFCLLIINNLTLTYKEVYLVRFGASTAPPVALIPDATNPATITQVDNHTLHYENSGYTTSTLHYALIPIGA